MGKKIKIGILCSVLVLMLTAGTLAVMYFVLQAPVFDRSGWVQTETGTQYWDYYGRPLTGWQKILEQEHHFDAEGNLSAGITEINGQRYLLSDQGTRGSGWTEYEGDSYYLNPDGTVYSGLLEEDSKRYYLDEDGCRVTSGWVDTEEGLYYLAEDGSILSGWLDTDGGRYYLEEDGSAYTGWLETDLARYYMDATGKMQTGFLEVSGVTRYFLSTGEYIPLVNPWNPVPEDYTLRLTSVGEYQVDTACRDALERMLSECREAGYECHINSAYRDEAYQQTLWDRYYAEYIEEGNSPKKALEKTEKRVARPGTSEHHLGLAVDLGGSSGVYEWLEAYSWEYGFIRRYPDGKTDVTGIMYEPWHYRYVGTTLAKELYESDLALEEYLQSLQN